MPKQVEVLRMHRRSFFATALGGFLAALVVKRKQTPWFEQEGGWGLYEPKVVTSFYHYDPGPIRDTFLFNGDYYVATDKTSYKAFELDSPRSRT